MDATVRWLGSVLLGIGVIMFVLAIGIDIGDPAIQEQPPQLAWNAVAFMAMGALHWLGALFQKES